MKAVNLHVLTRPGDSRTMSLLYRALSGRDDGYVISPHEAGTLRSLSDLLASYFQSSEEMPDPASCREAEPLPAGGPEGSRAQDPDRTGWLALLDGFYFSYVIEHIGKEFDLIKISSDAECVLNIELKSEDIGEERIRRQLEQNRYYLSHIARTILSFTYVMETGALYSLSAKGYFSRVGVSDLAAALGRPALRSPLAEGIDSLFKASDYLISPVASPEKFLQGQYFLTNQQFDFKRRILEHLEAEASPVVSVSGITGTGKTLLLFDLAMHLSSRQQVLLVHAGPLRKGHLILDERLRHVAICSAADGVPPEAFAGCDFLLIDEADHLLPQALLSLIKPAAQRHVPVILTCDPHHLLSETLQDESGSETLSLIGRLATLSLTFSGNIRINRPVYSFLRTLLNLKDRPGRPCYDCVDVLFAGDPVELSLLTDYYRLAGYEQISFSSDPKISDGVIAQEYNRVLVILDEDFYYDDALHLCVRTCQEERIRILYEALSRTREKLCLIIAGSGELFTRVLGIRLNLPPEEHTRSEQPQC